MEELKQKLIDLCNNSGLPLEAILFVTKDLWRDVEDTFRRMKEAEQAEAAQKAAGVAAMMTSGASLPKLSEDNADAEANTEEIKVEEVKE